MAIMVEQAGAERGLLILARNGTSQIEAEAMIGRDKVEVQLRQEPVSPAAIPESILHYVVRTGQSVILDDASAQNLFSSDKYLQRRHPRSIFCLPITKQGELMGILYLENNLTPCAFTPDRQAVLELLASQAAISLENAHLYADLVQENADRKKAEEAVRSSKEELNRLNRTLQTLYQGNRAQIHATDEIELFQAVCQILVEVGGLRLAWVGRCENDIEKTVRPVARAGYGVDYLDQVKISWGEESELGRGPTGIALRTGKPYWIKDTRIDPSLAPWRTDAIARGYASCVTLPLIADGDRLGNLSLYAAEPNVFNESTIEQYTDLANNLAYGVTALRTRDERKLAEDALRESEQRLQDVVDNTTAVVFVKDLDLRYILVNREYERRHNVQRDQIRGKTDFDIHPHYFAETVRANDLRVIEAGAPIQFEETVPAAEGERHYIVVKFLLRDGTGKPYAICGIATDITDLKGATEKIREHAVKLSQANEVLKRSLNGLARDKNLHGFVDQVLVVLTEQLGSHSSTLWLIDVEQRRAYLHSVCQDGGVVAARNSDHPNASEPHEWSSDDPGWVALQMKRPFLHYDAVNDPQATHTPAQRAYFSALGVKSLLWIPLVFGEQLIGMLSVRITANRQIDDEDLDFAQALAQQVTLALELARLAEQAKQTALALERERAAQERAAELGKANEALLECLDALASVPELDEFLGQVMVAITRQLGAASSALRWRNDKQSCLTLDFVFQDERVMTPAEAKYPEGLRSIPLDERQLRMLKEPATVMHLLDKFAAIPDSHRSYLVGLGVKTLLIIPLVITRQLVGSLTFRFTEDRQFRPEEIEIARALAIQASLAIQLTRLAKSARQSAVLAERNELAGEIHDSLAQFFTGISMQLGAAKEVIKAGGASVLSYLERASDLAQFGLSEARRSAFSLQPTIIEESGLLEALQKLVERSNIPGRLRCNFHSTGAPEESLPPSVQQDLLRIAQEAISNAARHAKPTVINVNLRCDPPDLILEVTDNGSGIADSQAASREGIGFSNMRARAENIGGQLQVRSVLGRGTTIVVHLTMNN